MLICGFEFPDELYYLEEHQVWARLNEADGTATVGITAMGVALAGEIYMCRPKRVGAVVEQAHSVAVVELSKTVVSVKSPVRGTVVEVNARLESEPELVHRAPYGEGWLARVTLADFASDRVQLVHGDDAVAAAMQRYARLNRLE